MNYTCISCIHSTPCLVTRKRSGWRCMKTQELVDQSRPMCDMFELPEVPFGYQPEIEAHLL
jgi:hypothetical protein